MWKRYKRSMVEIIFVLAALCAIYDFLTKFFSQWVALAERPGLFGVYFFRIEFLLGFAAFFGFAAFAFAAALETFALAALPSCFT